MATNIGTISRNMPTNFELKRLKPKLDIVEKPENRVHKLTDSNVSLVGQPVAMLERNNIIKLKYPALILWLRRAPRALDLPHGGRSSARGARLIHLFIYIEQTLTTRARLAPYS